MRATVLLLVLAGCDSLWNLDDLRTLDAGGSGDGGMGVDARSDAVLCTPAGHDEDVDQTDDACDLCPTYAPTSSPGDTDADGLPNECDFNNAPSKRDKIVAYWGFASSGDLISFNSTGVVTPIPAENLGLVHLNATNASPSSLTTSQAFAPKRVDFHLGAVTTVDLASELRIKIGIDTICTFKGADCSGSTTARTCLQYAGTSLVNDWTQPASQATRISVFQVNSNVQCEISRGSNSTIVGRVDPMPVGAIGISTTATASLKLEAIVIYGEN